MCCVYLFVLFWELVKTRANCWFCFMYMLILTHKIRSSREHLALTRHPRLQRFAPSLRGQQGRAPAPRVYAAEPERWQGHGHSCRCSAQHPSRWSSPWSHPPPWRDTTEISSLLLANNAMCKNTLNDWIWQTLCLNSFPSSKHAIGSEH